MNVTRQNMGRPGKVVSGAWAAYYAQRNKFKYLITVGLPMRFPQGVDVALAYEGPMSLPQYVDSEQFVRDCRDAQEAYREIYATDEWTLDTLRSGVLPNGHLLIDRFCDMLLRRIEAQLPRYRQNTWTTDRSEILARIRKEALERVEKFKPATVIGGRLQINRFEGYLCIHVFHKAKAKLIEDSKRDEQHCSLEGFQGEDGRSGFDSIVDTATMGVRELVDQRQCKDAVVAALHEDLVEIRAWELFRAVVFGEETIRSVAVRLRLGKTRAWDCLEKVQETVTNAIADFCPEADTILEQFEWRHFCSLLGLWFDEEEFVLRVPRPG